MISKEEKELVIARLQTMPPTLKLSVGGEGTFTKDELIESVEKETKLGEFIVKIYMANLRSFK